MNTAVILQELKRLVHEWKQQAMDSVPPAYAERNLHYKYFRLDNEAAGLFSCAEELEEFIRNIERNKWELDENN